MRARHGTDSRHHPDDRMGALILAARTWGHLPENQRRVLAAMILAAVVGDPLVYERGIAALTWALPPGSRTLSRTTYNLDRLIAAGAVTPLGRTLYNLGAYQLNLGGPTPQTPEGTP